MDLQAFGEYFGYPDESLVGQEINDVFDLIDWWGGHALKGGLLRILDREQSRRALAQMRCFWPRLPDVIVPFATNWQGNILALVPGEAYQEPHDGVMVADAHTCDYYVVWGGLERFLNTRVMADDLNVCLPEQFAAWRDAGKPMPSAEQLVGYVKLLFLGGKDELSNMDLYDAYMYWDMSAQLWEQVKDLPEGTPISGVSEIQ